MVSEKFLIDTNSFITPYRLYYAFDLIPAYWKELSKCISTGRIILLDMVKNEIDKGQDDLAQWINKQGFVICNHVDAEIIRQYSLIIQYLQGSDLYYADAYKKWSLDNVADPWLIAAAKTKGYTIITFETLSGGLSPKQKNKSPKIPDVAKKFDVKTADLYYMMRQLGIKI